jgi:hypothetical protein
MIEMEATNIRRYASVDSQEHNKATQYPKVKTMTPYQIE